MPAIRIASSNVFWFQGRPFPPDSPGEPQPPILKGLAEIWRKLNPHLLCLQEVQSRSAFSAVREELGMSGSWCPGAELPQYGTAVLWRRGALRADWRDAAPAPQRAWQIAALPRRGGGEVLVANCHLPSNRQLSDAAAAVRRIEEISTVLAQERKPDLVLGDFNEQPGGPLGEFLTKEGYVDVAVQTDRQTLGTTPKARRGDQIWVATGLLDRIRGYGVIPEGEMRTEVPGKQHLSDHFPLWADLEI